MSEQLEEGRLSVITRDNRLLLEKVSGILRPQAQTTSRDTHAQEVRGLDALRWHQIWADPGLYLGP